LHHFTLIFIIFHLILFKNGYVIRE
jgi:hypothetical protein